MPNTQDKVTITPAAGKIVFQADKNDDGTLTEVGSIDAEAGANADQIVIDKAKMTNSSTNGGTF
tara:strand:- start:42 stop:233 length:192 start_codon:yes stop_codon:yes gene_type:complete